MNFLTMVLAAALVGAAGDRVPAAQRPVTVCMNPGANAAAVYRAEMIASKILSKAGVKLYWKSDPRSCDGPRPGIVIHLTAGAPVDHHPGAMAYAMPYQRTTIVVFHDRVQAARVSPLLAHVLVHEITHILQGVAVHSASGMMKAKWDSKDYAEMERRPFELTADDKRLIHSGLDARERAEVTLGNQVSRTGQ